MKKEEKELLLKDLCSRLPYGVKASYCGVEEECETWDEIEGITIDGYVDIGQYSLPIEGIKPYLFPLSSMNEEQLLELSSISFENSIDSSIKTLNWCYKNHFDVNNLIPMGLAIDATGLNIY